MWWLILVVNIGYIKSYPEKRESINSEDVWEAVPRWGWLVSEQTEGELPQHGWIPPNCLGAQMGPKEVNNDNFPFLLLERECFPHLEHHNSWLFIFGQQYLYQKSSGF